MSAQAKGGVERFEHREKALWLLQDYTGRHGVVVKPNGQQKSYHNTEDTAP
jgi:hypothetical protein